MIQGMSGGFVAVGMSLVMNVTPKKQLTWAMGVFQASMVMGVMFGPLVGGMIADTLGYRMPFVIFCALSFLCLVAVRLMVPKQIGLEKARGREPFMKQLSYFMKNVDSVKNTYMKQLLYSFFKDEAFAKKFKCVSAAKTVHHGFAGGLLEHSLSVTRLCDKMSSNYDFLNRDLLITCAMLHDVGKVKELSEFPKNDYTDEGNFLGHIVIGYEMVMEKVKQINGFPDMLAMQIGHCILSHHGELEYGSPKKPSIAEAVALSMADNMDAKLETLREALEAKDTNDWLGYNRWLDSNIRRTTNEF